ncbi:MAG TPA: hypothetical protein VLK84_24315 [Longimicrobium sp.]|nr:hypothetical protein [Longimicrobium sp.]
MFNRSIPADEQIDAVLAGQLGILLDRHRLSREDLQRKWSVSVGDIVAKARRHGLESFVRDAPAGDGVHLVRHSSGYEVAFIDHGCRLFEERFESLDAAFAYWIEARLDAGGLPHDGGR